MEVIWEKERKRINKRLPHETKNFDFLVFLCALCAFVRVVRGKNS